MGTMVSLSARQILVAVLLLATSLPASSFLSVPHPAPHPPAPNSPHRWAPSATCKPPASRIARSALLRLAARGESSGDDLEKIQNIFTAVPLVEPGCVLVASPDEIDHFSRHAVVLVLSHGAQGEG